MQTAKSFGISYLTNYLWVFKLEREREREREKERAHAGAYTHTHTHTHTHTPYESTVEESSRYIHKKIFLSITTNLTTSVCLCVCVCVLNRSDCVCRINWSREVCGLFQSYPGIWIGRLKKPTKYLSIFESLVADGDDCDCYLVDVHRRVTAHTDLFRARAFSLRRIFSVFLVSNKYYIFILLSYYCP